METATTNAMILPTENGSGPTGMSPMALLITRISPVSKLMDYCTHLLAASESRESFPVLHP